MNSKIVNKLQQLIKHSPHILMDGQSLQTLISGTFDVNLDPNKNYSSILAIANEIDQQVMQKYFTQVWQPKTKKYKYSGLSIIDEVNALKPLSVVDLGCGFNEFKGKIDNLVGVDPYNDKADIKCGITSYKPEQKHDVAICLGSVNFGGPEKIFFELQHIVSNVVKPGGLIFFRANPGEMHNHPEAEWIDFFDWTPEFIVDVCKALLCLPIVIKQDTGNRLYFVWKTVM